MVIAPFDGMIKGMSIEQSHLTITVAYDPENSIWFVRESDLPGLCAEAGSLDALNEIIADLAPDLLETNLPVEQRQWPLRIQHTLPVMTPRAA